MLRERLTLTLRNGQRLQGLVNGLLDLLEARRGQAGGARRWPCRLPTFFRDLLSLFEGLAHERGVELRGTVALPDELTLLFDADKAEKVVDQPAGQRA